MERTNFFIAKKINLHSLITSSDLLPFFQQINTTNKHHFFTFKQTTPRLHLKIQPDNLEHIQHTFFSPPTIVSLQPQQNTQAIKILTVNPSYKHHLIPPHKTPLHSQHQTNVAGKQPHANNIFSTLMLSTM